MLSTIALLVLTFAILGLLLGLAASYDIPKNEIQVPSLSENTDERDPEVQQRLFEDCIEDARSDGKLTDDEYFSCAYDIYD